MERLAFNFKHNSKKFLKRQIRIDIKSEMKLKYFPFTIELKDTFTLAHGSRATTPAVLVEIEHDGIVGYGEASLPPYLTENQNSVIDFLIKVDLGQFNDPTIIDSIIDYIDKLSDGNSAAKASVDIALHDLLGKIKGLPLHQMLNIEMKDNISSSYTIGISEIEKIRSKIEAAAGYEFYKIKLGTRSDKEIIEKVYSLTDKPLFVDVNQGWPNENYALNMIEWLANKNVKVIEQPLPKQMWEGSKWLKDRSPLPIIADEAVRNINDLEKANESFSGINIKVMKCGGIRNTKLMIEKAKQLNLKIMVGCMTETSCGVTAASHLASLADWVDLDGAELISNDPFTGLKIVEGKLIIPDLPGLGVNKIRNF